MEELEESHGLSVVIKNKEEFEAVQRFLGEKVLYTDFVPQMAIERTGIIIHHENTHLFSPGSIGKASYQEEFGTRLVKFEDHFKL